MDEITGNGDIVISGFIFERIRWQQIISLINQHSKELLVGLLGDSVTTVLLTSNDFVVCDANLCTWTCAEYTSGNLNSYILVLEPDALLEKLGSFLKASFHGLGFGSMRYQELERLETSQVRFVAGQIHYWSRSKKRPSVRWGLNKMVHRRLPVSISRLYLIFLGLCNDTNTLIPVDTSSYGIPWAFQRLFGFHQLPSMLNIRHFWTDVTRMVVGVLDEVCDTVAAQSGHSTYTEKTYYTTEMATSQQFDRFHSALGEMKHESVAKCCAVSLLHCRHVAKIMFGHTATLHKEQEDLLHSILKNERHIIASLPKENVRFRRSGYS